MKRQRISLVWWTYAIRRWCTGRAPESEARLIHREPDLAVAWLPGRTSRLVLVFISIRRAALHPNKLEFRGIASDEGRNHVLFINDRERSWYSEPGKRDRIEAVVRRFMLEHGIQTVWSMGNSMGGYGAILFADRLPISKVVAFVPQILMTDAVIDQPDWTANRPNIRPTVERDLTPIIASADCIFHVVTGDAYADDRIHFGHLRQRLADARNVKIVIAPGQGHGVADWLKKQGQLARLVAALWSEDRPALEDCSKAIERPLDLTLY